MEEEGRAKSLVVFSVVVLIILVGVVLSIVFLKSKEEVYKSEEKIDKYNIESYENGDTFVIGKWTGAASFKGGEESEYRVYVDRKDGNGFKIEKLVTMRKTKFADFNDFVEIKDDLKAGEKPYLDDVYRRDYIKSVNKLRKSERYEDIPLKIILHVPKGYVVKNLEN